MTPDEWARVAELLETGITKLAAERERWLAEVCDNPTVRDEVQALLAAYDKDPEYLEHAPPGALADAEVGRLVGRRLGAYRLTREIGRGGMGVVYEAARDDDTFERQVAVKILPPWSASVLASRFRLEQQVLAGLDHPGIARLIDAGGTGDLPYCVMEFVDGQPIDAWCDAQGLGIAARVDLFALVCDAVSYAHTHLVVHRDLKPSNILVTRDGQPKLLDFGIAALLDAESGASAGGTRFSGFTPDFASPEQVRGERVTTATDVYSLGVLLYVMLTGRRPYAVDARSPLDVARTICDVEPAPPSKVALREHARLLHGDLDAIVAKAMRKNPADRYASVTALSADLHAWRAHRPIAATGPTWSYVAQRFIRRHRAGVAAGATIAAAIITGVATTLWQARAAERARVIAEARFQDVRQLANAVVGPLYDAIAKVPGSTEARRTLVKEALTYLDRLSQQAGNDVALKVELADAYEKIGDVQGNVFGPNLGDAAGAKASYSRLLDLRRAVADARPNDPQAQAALANAHIRLSDMALGEGRFDDAATGYRRALSLLGSAAQTPSNETAAIMAARTENRLGVSLNWGGHREESAQAFSRSQRIAETWIARAGGSPQMRTELMNTLGNAGDADYMAERFDGALQHFQAALTMARSAATATPTAQTQRSLHLILTRVAAALQELGRLDDAVRVLNESVQIQRELAVGDERNVRLTFDLGASVQNQGTLAFQRGRLADSLGHLRESLALFEAGIAASPSSVEQQFNIAQTRGWVGRVEAALGRHQQGIEMLRKSLALYRQDGVSARKPSEQYKVWVWLGDALAAQAKASGASPGAEVRAAYVSARDGLDALAKKGALEPSGAAVRTRAEAAIASIDGKK